jgi:integrase
VTNTISGYRVAVKVHLIPGLGKHRLDRLEPEHLEKLYVRMIRNGSAPATAHQAHRTMRTALNEAVRRGHLVRNPATLAKAPRVSEKAVEPYNVDEVRLLLKAAMAGRNGARWAIALALGLRQGEVLGLKWSDVDLDRGSLVVRRARLRPRWRHGCDGTCGGQHGGHCPARVAERPETADTTSRAGRRVMGLPDELVELLRAHRVEQGRERDVAAMDGSRVAVRDADRCPAQPAHRLDGLEEAPDGWPACEMAGCTTHATPQRPCCSFLLGVPERAVMGVMGWSNTAMAARYQHVTSAIQRDIAGRVGGLIWPTGKGEMRLQAETPAGPRGPCRRFACSGWR